jgi:hypothetical protein
MFHPYVLSEASPCDLARIIIMTLVYGHASAEAFKRDFSLRWGRQVPKPTTSCERLHGISLTLSCDGSLSGTTSVLSLTIIELLN